MVEDRSVGWNIGSCGWKSRLVIATLGWILEGKFKKKKILLFSLRNRLSAFKDLNFSRLWLDLTEVRPVVWKSSRNYCGSPKDKQ